MLTRLRVWLHDRRCGHQTYEDTWLVAIPVSTEGDPTHGGRVHRCHGCGWKVAIKR